MLTQMKFLEIVAAIVIVIVMSALMCGLAHGQTTGARIYDDKGNFRGRVVPDYAGRCCVTLDSNGNRDGRLLMPPSFPPRQLGPSPDVRGHFSNGRQRQ
jgi:hypothetical protein